MIHEDNRRILTEFDINGKWKTCKYIEVKGKSIMGKHFHQKKDELFIILEGTMIAQIDNNEPVKLNKFDQLLVKKGQVHSFEVDKGLKFIGLCSEYFDINDEIAV